MYQRRRPMRPPNSSTNKNNHSEKLEFACNQALNKVTKQLEEVKEVVALSKRLEPYVKAIVDAQPYYNVLQILRWSGIELCHPQKQHYEYATSRIMCIYECRHTIFQIYYFNTSRAGGLLFNDQNMKNETHESEIQDCHWEYHQFTHKRQAIQNELNSTLFFILPQVLVDIIYNYGLPVFDSNVWKLPLPAERVEEKKDVFVEQEEQRRNMERQTYNHLPDFPCVIL